MAALNQNFSKLIVGFIVVCFLTACETTIYPTLEHADPILVVDAWINNLPGKQTIVLTQTQSYFDNTLPTGVSGATVTVTDSQGRIFNFVEDTSTAGNYVWTPTGSEVFGKIGQSYSLKVIVKGESFISSSKMSRVPPIDSITFDTTKQTGSNKTVIRGQFWATDPVGPGDTYWIKAYKNGVLLNKPAEINYSYDAGFSAGGETDGVTFITPIRRGINAQDKDTSSGATGNLSPFKLGDSVNVQIHSITLASYNYLDQLVTQTDRPGGFSELFAKPLANVSTNITNANTAGSAVVGFFNTAAVSSLGKRYVKKP